MKAPSRPTNGGHVPRPRRASGESAEDDCWVPMSADALHDLAGPVNQLQSLTDLIQKRYRGKLDDEAEAVFGFLQASSDRLQNLVSGLRTYTRIVGRRGPYSRFDANAILAGALATIQQKIDQNGALVTHDPLPEVYGDPNQICCIFASLIENAIKFRSERRPEIHVTAVPEGNDWLFSVRDNGIGIDGKHRDRIFRVFKRIHNEAYPGTGMGLAIVNGIVERHGGRIWVESHLGHGATFFFALPKTTGHTPAKPRHTNP